MDITTLHESIEYSRRKMEHASKERADAISQFVGFHYSENGAAKPTPVNFIELAVTIYARSLAARSPQCIISTQLPDLKPFASDMEIAINHIPEEIGFTQTIRDVVVEALFGMGVVKCGIALTNKKDQGVAVTDPFVDLVNMDDYILDMTARSWKEGQYEGNEYWMRLDDARELFDASDLTVDEDRGDNASGQETAHAITVNDTTVPLADRIRLRDIYIFSENKLVTYVPSTMRVLRETDWDGPEGSPYIKLWYEDVPSNLLPLPPVAVWRDMHDLGNALYRKLGRQADNRKSVAAFQGGNEDDIERFKQAKDGEGIRYNGPKPDEISVGGVDQPTLAFYLSLRDQFNIFAGNIDSIGGLARQTETATQDRMLNEAASSRVNDMADRTREFAKAVFKRLAWYLWTDPSRKMNLVKVVNSKLGIAVPVKWTPETRDGDFIDYNVDIDVFSMQDQTPSMKVEKFGAIWDRFILPMLDRLEAQGVYVDMQSITEFLSKNTNLPELIDFIKFADPYLVQQRSPEGNPKPDYVSKKPAVTQRTYVRVNRPGATQAGKDYALSQMLLGGRPQRDEAAGMVRS